MSDEKKLPTFTVAGEFMGRFISATNFHSYVEAYTYASLKDWTNFRVIRG